MSRFVVDASVAVKWFLPEVHADSALRLLDAEHTLAAPDLLFPEVGNALWKRVRRREVTLTEAARTVNTLVSLPLQVHPSRLLMPLGLEVAHRTQRSVYDCLYLVLAMFRRCPMVTADRKLYEAVRRGPLSRHVLWIADVP